MHYLVSIISHLSSLDRCEGGKVTNTFANIEILVIFTIFGSEQVDMVAQRVNDKSVCIGKPAIR